MDSKQSQPSLKPFGRYGSPLVLTCRRTSNTVQFVPLESRKVFISAPPRHKRRVNATTAESNRTRWSRARTHRCFHRKRRTRRVSLEERASHSQTEPRRAARLQLLQPRYAIAAHGVRRLRG